MLTKRMSNSRLSHAVEHGDRAAAREFNINDSIERKWRKQEDEPASSVEDQNRVSEGIKRDGHKNEQRVTEFC